MIENSVILIVNLVFSYKYFLFGTDHDSSGRMFGKNSSLMSIFLEEQKTFYASISSRCDTR